MVFWLPTAVNENPTTPQFCRPPKVERCLIPLITPIFAYLPLSSLICCPILIAAGDGSPRCYATVTYRVFCLKLKSYRPVSIYSVINSLSVNHTHLQRPYYLSIAILARPND